MFIPIIGLLILFCQQTTSQLRDESGLLNLKEVSSLVNGVCERELNIHLLLQKPFISAIVKNILKIRIPLLPGPSRFRPLYIFEWLEVNLGNLEDRLSAILEGKSPLIEESYVQHPNHTNLEIADLLAVADFLCKTTHLWFDIVTTKISDLVGLWHIRLPLLDFHNRLNLIKALDFLDLFGIPDRIHRLLTGQLGLSTTTTTTHVPTFLESIFNSGVKTTTPKPKKPGFLGGLFGGHQTSTPTTTTTTTTPTPGLFGSGFLGSLFGHNDPPLITNSLPSFSITLEATTKPSSGLFGALFGGGKLSNSTTLNSNLENETDVHEDINKSEKSMSISNIIPSRKAEFVASLFNRNKILTTTFSPKIYETDTNNKNILKEALSNSFTTIKTSKVYGGLFQRNKRTTKSSITTNIPEEYETIVHIVPDKHDNDFSSKKPSGFFGRNKRISKTPIITTNPEPYKTEEVFVSTEQTNKNFETKKSNGLFNGKTTSITTTHLTQQVSESDKLSSKKQKGFLSGLFKRKRTTISTLGPEVYETESTFVSDKKTNTNNISTKKSNGGLFHRTKKLTTTSHSDQPIRENDNFSSKKPTKFLGGLFKRKRTTISTLGPEVYETESTFVSDKQTNTNNISTKKSNGGLFHRTKKLTTTHPDQPIRANDNFSSKKPTKFLGGLFKKKRTTISTLGPEVYETESTFVSDKQTNTNNISTKKSNDGFFHSKKIVTTTSHPGQSIRGNDNFSSKKPTKFLGFFKRKRTTLFTFGPDVDVTDPTTSDKQTNTNNISTKKTNGGFFHRKKIVTTTSYPEQPTGENNILSSKKSKGFFGGGSRRKSSTPSTFNPELYETEHPSTLKKHSGGLFGRKKTTINDFDTHETEYYPDILSSKKPSGLLEGLFGRKMSSSTIRLKNDTTTNEEVTSTQYGNKFTTSKPHASKRPNRFLFGLFGRKKLLPTSQSTINPEISEEPTTVSSVNDESRTALTTSQSTINPEISEEPTTVSSVNDESRTALTTLTSTLENKNSIEYIINEIGEMT